MAGSLAPGRSGRRATIIGTLGPAVDSDGRIRELIEIGIDAFRLNLGFGDQAEHAARIERVRNISAIVGRQVAIIADIPGPKIRLGRIPQQRMMLEPKSRVRFVRDPGASQLPGSVPPLPTLGVDASFFHDDMMRGDRILLDHGLVELRVSKVVNENAVEAEVVDGGQVSERTAVHLPGMPLRQGPLTEADRAHLSWAVQHDADFVELTYVRDDRDILAVREHLEGLGKNLPIIAKIERSEAFARLDGILNRADAVMIRRGDLGAEIELTRVPIVQKEIVRLANNRGVPVIIATQMLSSMLRQPRPTRAEASDVSNAIADGADGVLLSSETAIGAYPIEAARMMDRIIQETERESFDRDRDYETPTVLSPFPDTTARFACRAAVQAQAKLIACFTESGKTAGLVAKYRPSVPILALCHHESAVRRLSIYWGVRCGHLDPVHDLETMVDMVDTRLLQMGAVEKGDRIVIVFGAPVGEMGHTNSVRLHKVGTKD